MESLTSRSVIFLSKPFRVPGHDETLPEGEYELETELHPAPAHQSPGSWKASVMVKLHPLASHPGLARTLTLSMADLDQAQARDKKTGTQLSTRFLEEMLADPMVQMVMEADGYSEMQLRHLYFAQNRSGDATRAGAFGQSLKSKKEILSIQVAENEGMPINSRC